MTDGASIGEDVNDPLDQFVNALDGRSPNIWTILRWEIVRHR